jgi:ribosomal protein S18 acetylase RimI-like enzyme
MRVVSLHDRGVLAGVFQRDPAIHVYELGDLDDFFWPFTTWYGLEEHGVIRSAVLVYWASTLPVVIALAREGQSWAVTTLLERMRPILPRRFYAHLAIGASRALPSELRVEPHGVHDRMVLADWSTIETTDVAGAVRLDPGDARDLEAFYAEAYPGNWFDPRLLETGAYFGVREDGALVAACGVHVVSRAQRVAALGNVAVRPDRRGQGLAQIAVAATCADLRPDVDHLALNVFAGNEEGVRLYRGLGFERVGSYEELSVGA